MNIYSLTHNDLPQAVSMLLQKMEKLEKLIEQANSEPENDVDDIMDVEQAATFLKRKKNTIYRYVSSGTIPHIKSEGKLLFNKERLTKWLQEGSVKTAKEIAGDRINKK